MDDRKKAKRAPVILSISDEQSAPIAICIIQPGKGIDGQPLLEGLLVDGLHQRQGIASQLLAKAEIKARTELKAKSLFAVTHPDNERARECFRKAGYTEMILLEKEIV